MALAKTGALTALSTHHADAKRYQVGRRLMRNRAATLGLVILSLVVICALTAPVIAPYGYDDQALSKRLLPPVWGSGGTWAHVLGTDQLGRDLLTRIMYGAQVSLLVGVAGVVIAGTVGVLLGLFAGFYEGKVDGVIMRVADVQLSFPYLLLAIAVMAVLKPSVVNLVVVLAVRSWVVYARTVRSSVLSIKQKEFVESAYATGASTLRIIFRHITPNALAPIIVISSFQLAELIITESSLSFLGLGVPPPTPSWGGMLSQGREYMTTSWWLAMFPGLAIMLTVLASNMLGDGLRDALDPRMKM